MKRGVLGKVELKKTRLSSRFKKKIKKDSISDSFFTIGKVMKCLITINISLISVLLVGCVTPKFIVKSDPPDAQVLILVPEKDEKKTLGKTPLEQKTQDLRELIGKDLQAGDTMTVQIEKEGYQTESFMIPVTRYGTLVSSLEVKLKEDNSKMEEKNAKSLLNHLFLAQKFALEQQYERAHIELDKILEKFPNFPRALSMRGAIYYTQKNYPESLKWYEEAIKYDPQMEDIVKMVSKIRGQKYEKPKEGGR